MKILEKIKQLFKRKVTNHELISITDLLNIPLKEDIKDKDLITIIEKYENNYENILNNKNYPNTSISNLEDIKNELDEIINLVENIIVGSNLQQIVLREESENTKISQLKLTIYKNEVIEKEKDVYLRLIALQELSRKKFISKKKKENLKKELEYMTGVYLTLRNVRTSLTLKIDAYLKNTSYNEEDFKERLSLAINLINFFLPKQLDNIDKLNIRDETKLALIETILEKYAYQNKESFNEVKRQLENIKTLEELEQIKKYYLLFSIYARNIITYHELSEYYEKKFNIKTENLSKLNKPLVDEKTNYLEQTTYQEIISSKARKILKENSFSSKLLTNSYLEVLLKKALNLPEEILNNPLETSLLLSLSKENGINYFLENYYIDIDEIENDENMLEILKLKKTYTFEKRISIKTLFWSLSRLNITLEKEKYNEEILKLHSIYNSLHKKQDDIYSPPEGIIKINNRKYYPKDENDLICENIICPSSLKCLILDYTNQSSSQKIYLNEGIEEVDIRLCTNEIDELTIPRTVKSLKISSLKVYGENEKRINNLIFEDYKDSELLNNDEALVNFIRENFHPEKTGNIKYHQPSSYALQKQKEYQEGRYSTFLDLDLFDHPYTNIEYKLVPNEDAPKIITFKDKNKKIEIKLEDVSTTYWRKEHFVNHHNVSKEDIIKVIDSLREKINIKELVKK